jgi:anthranilate phosphoribosyltransferase
MSLLSSLLPSLNVGRELTPTEIESTCAALASSEVDSAEKAVFLVALADKGETGAEIAGFAACFRKLARPSPLDRWAADGIDVCGTGGDKSGTFNISTVVTFVLAASGIPVLKHGNRSITSKCGSADLLEAIGVRINADDGLLTRAMEELGFVFLFAPVFHPAFKEIGPVRKELAERGRRSVFNILGPLINPAKPAHQLLGVFSESILAPMADALHRLGLTAGLVVHGRLSDRTGIDELTVATENIAGGFGRLIDHPNRIAASDAGLAEAPFEHLRGGDVEQNLVLLDRVLDGTAPSGLIDTVLLNAATGLYVAGRVDSIRDGVAPAREQLLGGGVKNLLERTRTFYQS